METKIDMVVSGTIKLVFTSYVGDTTNDIIDNINNGDYQLNLFTQNIHDLKGFVVGKFEQINTYLDFEF